MWQISIVIVKTTIIGEKFRIESNKSKNRTISDEVRTPNFLLKERSLIGWKFLRDPGWSRLHTVIGHYRVALWRCFNAKLTAKRKIWEWFFYSHENETHYYRARFPLSLVLKVRVVGTGKWSFFFKRLPRNLYLYEATYRVCKKLFCCCLLSLFIWLNSLAGRIKWSCVSISCPSGQDRPTWKLGISHVVPQNKVLFLDYSKALNDHRIR